jgi:hypothetical protein
MRPMKAQRHDEGRREMGEADVAEDELMRGFGDLIVGGGIGDQVAGDTQDGDGGGVDPVPQPHRRLVDIDRCAATDAFEVRLGRVPRQERSGQDRSSSRGRGWWIEVERIGWLTWSRPSFLFLRGADGRAGRQPASTTPVPAKAQRDGEMRQVRDPVRGRGRVMARMGHERCGERKRGWQA